MDTRHLRSFLKVAELGSITRAADALGIAQPSLSLQLQRLEDELGVRLFERSARGAMPTHAGRIFQEHATRMMLMAEQALDDVQQVKADASGRVAFAIPPSLGPLFGTYFTDSVKRYAPKVSLRLIEALTGQIADWVEQGTVDLGIIYALEATRHICVRTLVREELYLLGPPGHFGDPATSLPVAPEDMAHFPLLLPSAHHGLRQCVESEAQRLGVSLSFGADVDAVAQICNLVSGGAGFTLMPLSAVASDIRDGQLSAARIGNGAFQRSLCLARQPGTAVSLATERVEGLAVTLIARLIRKGKWIAEPLAGLGEQP